MRWLTDNDLRVKRRLRIFPVYMCSVPLAGRYSFGRSYTFVLRNTLCNTWYPGLSCSQGWDSNPSINVIFLCDFDPCVGLVSSCAICTNRPEASQKRKKEKKTIFSSLLTSASKEDHDVSSVPDNSSEVNWAGSRWMLLGQRWMLLGQHSPRFQGKDLEV